MKKLMIAAIALIAMTATAQRGGGERGLKDLSAEDQATLQTKKMTLALDLDKAQANKVYEINLANAKERKAKMEARKNTEKGERKAPTAEERLQRQNAMLDARIATQNEMKRILNEEQFKQWRRMAQKRKGEKGKGNRRGKGERRGK